MTSVSFNVYDSDPYPESPDPLTQKLEVELMYESAQRTEDAQASGLSERDRGILEFERQWWKYAGAKEQAIRELFDMSSTRYYQLINTLIDTPDALEFDPMLVKRLRRMRSSRQQARSASRVGS